MDNLKRKIKPRGHFIRNRKWEVAIGIALFLAGALLIWDAYDGRGKKVPWPAGGLLPW